MYVPPAFQFSAQEALAFVKANDFGVLVTRDLTLTRIAPSDLRCAPATSPAEAVEE